MQNRLATLKRAAHPADTFMMEDSPTYRPMIEFCFTISHNHYYNS